MSDQAKNQPKWYEIKALAAPEGESERTVEIYVYGNIGDRWDENGVIAADFVRDLAAIEADRIVLRINSFGGSVPDALAIYNALKRHAATVDVQVDGIAFSAASYIAMSGDTVTMAANAMLMIHAPMTWSGGNAADLRSDADMLDKYARLLAAGYAETSGKEESEVLGLLTDGKDHFFTAVEALAEGFCHKVGPEVAVAAALARSFDLSRFSTRAAQAAAANPKEQTMPESNKPAAPAQPSADKTFARDKAMNAEILAAFKPFGAREGVTALQTEILADPSITVAQASARLLAHLGQDAAPATPQGAHPRVETVEDETDKRRDAVVQALLARAGIRDAKGEPIRAAADNPYRGARLLDLARTSAQRAGARVDGMMPMDVVAAGFTQSTSDFPVLLENTMHKALQAAYARAALTWTRFAATGSVSDFRAHKRYRLGSFGNLDAVSELGEFRNKTIPDGEAAAVTIGTKGNIINLSRQAIINDDLGAFVGLAAMLGNAAARTVEADVYALLALNAGLGPTMGDGKTLFHADHGNVGTGAALSVEAIEADRVLMASQKDVSGNDYLDLRPDVLLVPIGLGGRAREINAAEYNDEANKQQRRPNVVRGLFGDIVDTPRLSGNRRYLFAAPSIAPVLEVAFLDGQAEPYIEQQTGFTVDGAQYKVRLDFGVAAIDHRGAVTNAGQ